MPITVEGFEIPDTFRERIEKLKAEGGPLMPNPNDPVSFLFYIILDISN